MNFVLLQFFFHIKLCLYRFSKLCLLKKQIFFQPFLLCLQRSLFSRILNRISQNICQRYQKLTDFILFIFNGLPVYSIQNII